VTVLLRELQDVKRRPFIRAASGPKVSVTQVWRLKRLGDVRVFKKRVAASGIDAAVAILLDRSGSMRDNGFETAVEVVHAFILALQRISGVKTSLDVFPGAVAESEQVLEFKQNLNAVTKHLRSIEPDGGTPTGTAMATRLARLIETRAEKKIMVVVTDGMPEFGQLPIVGAVMARAAMEDVPSRGSTPRTFETTLTLSSPTSITCS
jgi:cobaltochelatase CobT